MKKPPPEDLHLWKNHIRDVKPLDKVKSVQPLAPIQRVKPLEAEKASVQGQERGYEVPSTPLPSLNRKALRRIKVEARLDLHGHTLESGYKALEAFLKNAQGRGTRKLLLITGKGAVDQENTLRRQVPRWLQETPLRQYVVSLHHPARPQDGGTGAYYVEVKRKGISPLSERVIRKPY